MTAAAPEGKEDFRAAAPEPRDAPGPSLAEEIRGMAQDARDVANTEVAFQKARAGFAAATVPKIIVYGVVGFAFTFTAVMASVFGVILGLSQSLTPWGATAVVAGGLLLFALGCAFAMLASIRRLRLALFGAIAPRTDPPAAEPGRVTTLADVMAARDDRDTARDTLNARRDAFRDDAGEHGVAGRIADDLSERARDAFDEAVAIADDNRAIVAGTLAALVVWFLRNPIIAALEGAFGDKFDTFQDIEAGAEDDHH